MSSVIFAYSVDRNRRLSSGEIRRGRFARRCAVTRGQVYYRNLRMSTVSFSSRLISRLVISLETSSAALY